MKIKKLITRLTNVRSTVPRDMSTAVKFYGASILCGQGNKIEEKLLNNPSSYDSSNFTVLRSIVRPGSVCLDVGANIGVYSAVMSVIGAEVHAFEPVPHIRQKLALNIALNGGQNVHINDFALGREDDVLNMRMVKRGERRGGTSTFLRNNNVVLMGEDRFDIVPVQVRMLDAYAANLERIDFIKIDVEGFELPVLQGGRNALALHKPAILFEHDQRRLSDLEIDEQEFAHLFAELGYITFEIRIEGSNTQVVPFAWDRRLRGNNLLALQGGI